MSTTALLKRLEALRQTIRIRRPRWIMLLVDGNARDQSAAEAIVEALEATDEDTVFLVKRYSDTDSDLPRFGGIAHF